MEILVRHAYIVSSRAVGVLYVISRLTSYAHPLCSPGDLWQDSMISGHANSGPSLLGDGNCAADRHANDQVAFHENSFGEMVAEFSGMATDYNLFVN